MSQATAASETQRFPTGRFDRPTGTDAAARAAWIAEIAGAPAQLRSVAASLSAAQLETPYRPGGWNARQVIHHLADSHMNAYCRFKLALTEDTPTIKPYDESAWAALPDTRDTPVEASIALVEALHTRWTALLNAMSDGDYARSFQHPEHGRTMDLGTTLALYAWHCRHHLGHLRAIAAMEPTA
jgi:hypothetical protein